MKRFILIILLCNAATGWNCIAAENAEEQGEPQLLIQGRDPFWPVGYTPPEPEAEVADVPHTPSTPDDDAPPVIEKDETEWPRLRVRGITTTLDGGYIAMIDGFGIAETGQIIQITERNIIFRWEVVEITKRGLDTRRIDARPAQ